MDLLGVQRRKELQVNAKVHILACYGDALENEGIDSPRLDLFRFMWKKVGGDAPELQHWHDRFIDTLVKKAAQAEAPDDLSKVAIERT